MIRIANDRISDLFGLAENAARTGRMNLADRYVLLARRIGTRYNVRLLPEYRELYCRACSAYWVEGRTVRTRLRSGRRTRRCLACGHLRRVSIREVSPRAIGMDASRSRGDSEEAVLVDDVPSVEEGADLDEGEDE